MANSYVDLSFEGRTLSMRQDQLTTSNVAIAFRLIPETIILVSDYGHVVLPGADGALDADPRNSWNVEGDKSTARPGGRACVPQPLPKLQHERWRPQSFPALGRTTGSNQGSVKWSKSIEICYLRGGTDVVQRSEHPITLDESSANVESIQEKLSHEAFDGARTRLLTCKNVLLADVEGTRGSKFWRSTKIIRAISEQDYHRLELARCGSSQPGTSGRKPSPLIHVVSDTDSEDATSFRPLLRRKKRPLCQEDSQSDSDSYTLPAAFKHRAVSFPPEISKALEEIKESLANYHQDVLSKVADSHVVNERAMVIFTQMLYNTFKCIICTEIVEEGSEALIPPCCQSILFCKNCIVRWTENSQSCPHCREPLQLQECQAFPFYRPLFQLLKDNRERINPQ